MRIKDAKQLALGSLADQDQDKGEPLRDEQDMRVVGQAADRIDERAKRERDETRRRGRGERREKREAITEMGSYTRCDFVREI